MKRESRSEQRSSDPSFRSLHPDPSFRSLHLLNAIDRDQAAASAPEINDLRLFERFRETEKLSRGDREAIILLIDGVLARRSIEGDIERRKRA